MSQATSLGQRWPQPWSCPPELSAAFDVAVEAGYGSDRLFERTSQQEALFQQASDFAAAHGWTSGDCGLYGSSMVRRAKDTARQNQAWHGYHVERARHLHELLQLLLAHGQVCVAASLPAAVDILLTGRIASQFETGTSGGLLDIDVRTIAELAAFGLEPWTSPHDRPIYGYVCMPGRQAQSSVKQYGAFRFVLKSPIFRRTSVTIGDSLNWNAQPVPLGTSITMRQASDACARRADADWGLMLTDMGMDHFQDLCYFEGQVHGGITINDIDFLAVTRARQDLPAERLAVFDAAVAHTGIEVRWSTP